MMGLAYLVFFAVYLLVSIVAVRGAIGYARKNGKSAKRWGWGAAFVMYSIVFWDWIPTVAVHQYYCAKDSGFWVYKTLDQWKAENPGVMETLMANKGEHDVHEGDMTNFTATHIWNQRFNLIFNKSGPFLVNNWRHEQIVLDSKTNEEMARFIDFSTGNGKVGGEPELRFWMHSDGCIGSDSQAKAFVKFAKQFRGAEK
jgi:hypothetical protein